MTDGEKQDKEVKEVKDDKKVKKAKNDNKDDSAREQVVEKYHEYDVKFRDTLKNLWYGKVPLVEAFWLYDFLVIFGLKIVGGMILFLGALLTVLGLMWAVFMVKPVFMAADAYKGEKHWAMAAKVAAVLMPILILLSIM